MCIEMAKKIIAACQNGDLESVKNLVEQQHVNPNKCEDDEHGRTPLHWASQYGHLEVMKYLVENCKCDPMCKDVTWENTPLHWAVRFANLEAVKYLVEDCSCDVVCRNNRNNTPLHDAAMGGKLEVVKYLISQKNCDPGVLGQRGRTPLHYACEMGNIAVVKHLLKCSEHVRPSCKDEAGNTPLHLAASNGSLSVVQHLIEETDNKIEMECKNNEGETPLHEAIKGGRSDIMKYLINKGCNPKCRGKFGGTALYYACQYGRLDEVTYLIESNKLPIDSPCDNSGALPLHVAAVNGRLNIVELLVETFQCKVDVRNSSRQTPLECAQGRHRNEIVSYLQGWDKNSALENQEHYQAYQEALKEDIAIPLRYLKVLFFGPPQTGKTSMRRRLVGEIENLKDEPFQASTGTAKLHDVIVKLLKDKTTASTAVITKSEWSSVKALFGKEKNTHETDLDEELQLLYQFIYKAAPPVKKRCVPSSVNTKETKDEPTKAKSQTVEAQSRVKTDTVTSTISVGSPKVNTNTSIHQQMPPFESEYDEDIEKAYKAFTRVMCTSTKDQLKILLDGTILMNMVDTGGHPAFLEMLPALTMGPALYLIFFRLNQELKNAYWIQYVSENNEDVQLGESSYTVEEVIFQALSSIACFSCTVPKKPNMPNPSHAAMLIGTHKDLLGSDPEAEIKAKDDALQKEISVADLFKAGKKFLRYASEDQLMFAVDNWNGDKKELTKVHKRLENIMKNYFDNFSIPASWLMFSIFLRRISKMGNHTLSLLQCHEIGARLKVRDTDEALWFLHHHVGTLMHFPDVEEIKDIVVCDPQVVFDSVTHLILNSFTFNHVDKLASENFKRTGQFSLEDIQKAAKRLKCDILPQLKLLKLLEYLNIIAPIKSDGSSAQSDAEVIYFMPAVLKHATEEELHVEQSPTDPVPVMIHFKCGFVPVGVFCAMIASLVAQEDTLGWNLQEPRDGHNLYKNKVTFHINGAFNITLISKPKQYEIHVARISTTDRALEKICQHVLETVCDILDQVISKMKYKRLISSHSDQTLYELGFKCPKHLSGDHLIINKPIGGVKCQPSQSAMSLWLNYLAIERKSTMICQKEEIFIDLRVTRLSPSFAQQSLVWFGEVTEISFAISAKEASHDVQSHGSKGDQAIELDVKNIVKNIVNVVHEANFSDGHWEQLGQQLIDHPNLTTIGANHQHNSTLCMSDTISTLGLDSSGETTSVPAKMELNVKNIGNVLHDAGFADAHWELLGKQLIKHSALLNIRANRHGEVSLCTIDTIAQWLRTDTEPSWEKLAAAVSKVEQYGEATANIVRKKAGIEKLPSQLPTHQLQCTQPQLLSVKKEIEQLQKKYEVLTGDVLKAFKRGNLPVEEVRTCIRQLPEPLKHQCSEFILNQASRLSQASSIDELFWILSNYWDFLNPDLLVHLTDRFGDGQAKKSVDIYMEELRGFQKRTKLKDFINQWTSSDARHDFHKIGVVLKDEWKERNLEDLEGFRDELSHKQWLMLRFDGIVEGSMAATFSFPKAADLELESLHGFFQEYQILRVFLNGACIVNLQEADGAMVQTVVERECTFHTEPMAVDPSKLQQEVTHNDQLVDALAEAVAKVDNPVGLAVIATNEYKKFPRDHLPGVKKDGQAMEDAFKSLRFATLWKPNISSEKMKVLVKSVIKYFQDNPPPKHYVVAFVFSGHGNEGDLVYGEDYGDVHLDGEIVKPLAEEHELGNISKLFFIDACRGENELKPVVKLKKSARELITAEGNYYIAYSTIPKHVAYTDDPMSGSAWMQILAKNLQERSESVSDIVETTSSELWKMYEKHPEIRTWQQPESVSRLHCGPVYLRPKADSPGVASSKRGRKRKGAGDTTIIQNPVQPPPVHPPPVQPPPVQPPVSEEYLRGFEVFAETSFVVPDSHLHSFEWQGHGLKLHIPEGAVPVEHTGCRVDIKAGFTGQFHIPDDLQLVSCVYWLSCSQKFVKPVTIEIEHCASLWESFQSSPLQFIAAKCSQAELPYQFKVLEKGTFESRSSYGSVQVSQFSFFGIGILKIFQSLQRYCSTVYYIQKQVNKWDVDFVVAPNLQASLTAIQERYSSLNATSGAGFEVQFEDEAISLAIPDDGVCLPNGWAIKPLLSPIISKQQVAVFKPGQLIPCCQLRVKLNNNENPVELEHKVYLLGTKGPQKFFTITCSPQEYVVEKSARLTGEKRKQSEDKQHESPTLEYVEKPVTATTGKRRQSGGEEQGVPKKRRSCNVISAAATHTPSLAATDDGMPFPSNESTTSSNRDLEMQKGAETLGIENLGDITSYLNPLNKTAIINLGIVLGLNYNRLNTIMDSQTFLNEMLAGWLQGMDQVLQTGVPTWKRLVEALKDPRVGQNGLASKIEQKQASQLM